MALYQPTNVTPSVLSGYGAGVIDAHDGLRVTWQVNGESPLVAYRIVIQENTSASTQLYTTGKRNLSKPFYGTDYEGNVQIFKSARISETTLANNGIVNGYANGYKIIIRQYWNDSDYVTQTSPSIFYTKDTPEFSIIAPELVEARKYTFSAEYTQAQGDTVDYIHWTLTDSNGNVVKDTGRIYGTADLRFSFDGFMDGQAYTLAAEIETSSGVEASSEVSFDVSYTTSQAEGVLTTCQPRNENCVLVSWEPLHYIRGYSLDGSTSYTIDGGKIYLASGEVRWDEENDGEINFTPPWCLVWQGSLRDPATSDGGYWFIRLEGINGEHSDSSKMQIGINAYNGSVALSAYVYGADGAVVPINYYLGAYGSGAVENIRAIVITPTDYSIILNTGTSIEHEPYSNNWVFTTENISEIDLMGTNNYPNVTDYLWVTNGEIPDNIFSSIVRGNFTPSWKNNSDITYFYAPFTNSLNAGNYTANIMDAKGMAIYRRDADGTYLTKIGEAPLGDGGIRDYSARSQHAYVYQGFLFNSTKYSSGSFLSSAFTPLWWNYVVLECEKDSGGNYHVLKEYLFSANISTSAISNNNAPNMLKNFTQYPLKQYDTSNYKSGTLTALIGKVDMQGNTYTDTTEMADEIMALSVSTNPKFLKDRKGNLLMIETDSAITMQADDAKREQPYTMALPWVEVGDASEANIITTEEDKGWPQDEVVETTVHIDAVTGSLMWSRGGDYYGSDLEISSGLLVQNVESGYNPAELKIENNNLLADA